LIAILFASFIHQNTGDLPNIAVPSDGWFNFTRGGGLDVDSMASMATYQACAVGGFLFATPPLSHHILTGSLEKG
jgi:hypothetical protein